MKPDKQKLTKHSGVPQQRRRTFTLMELLAALALTAVIMSGVLSLLVATLRARDRQFQQQNAAFTQGNALRRLIQDLRGMVPPATAGVYGAIEGVAGVYDNCRHDSLQFASAVNPPQHGIFGTDLINVSYALQLNERSDAFDLVRSVRRNLLPSTESVPEETVLLSTVRELSFAYFTGEEWQDSWTASASDNRLPEAVRVRIATGRPDTAGPAESLEQIVAVVTRTRLEANSADRRAAR